MAVVRVPENPEYGPEIIDGDHFEEPTSNARQGVTGHNVRYVLTIGTVGIFVLLAVIYLVYFG